MNKKFKFKYITVFATHDETIAQKLYENESDVVMFEGGFYNLTYIERERIEMNLEDGYESSDFGVLETLDEFKPVHMYEIYELKNIVYVSDMSSKYAYEHEQHGLCVRKFLKIS